MSKAEDIKKPSKNPMDRVNAIICNQEYQDWIIANNQAEYGSEYCRHGLEHAFDVARIAYELWLDHQGNPVAKDIVYAAALLHDIGYWSKFEDLHVDECDCHEHGDECDCGGEQETPFQVAASLSEEILAEAGYHPAVIGEIIKAIRQMDTDSKEGLSVILRRANELSRPCFLCPIQASCDREPKNTRLEY
jgi:uncharacterized protein